MAIEYDLNKAVDEAKDIRDSVSHIGEMLKDNVKSLEESNKQLTEANKKLSYLNGYMKGYLDAWKIAYR